MLVLMLASRIHKRLAAIQSAEENGISSKQMLEAIAPNSQTVAVALGRIEVMTGRPDLAQARARAFLERPKDDYLWWTYKNGGIDAPGMAYLRKRVRR